MKAQSQIEPLSMRLKCSLAYSGSVMINHSIARV